MHPQIEMLNKIPQTEQKSQAWLEERKNYLTSSDAGTALGLNKYQKPVELLFAKCGAGKPFFGNEATKYGEKYEDEAVEMYCNAMGMKQNEFGLIPYNAVSRSEGDLCIADSYFSAGSPDGIAVSLENPCSCEPVLLEVKCPFRRKIVLGHCPEQYYPQVQLNMYICNLKKGDFIEYKPSRNIDNIELNIVHFDRNDEWLKENIPKLKEFWDSVLYYRSAGIEKHPQYDKYAWTEEKQKKAEKKVTIPRAPCCFSDDEK